MGYTNQAKVERIAHWSWKQWFIIVIVLLLLRNTRVRGIVDKRTLRAIEPVEALPTQSKARKCSDRGLVERAGDDAVRITDR